MGMDTAIEDTNNEKRGIFKPFFYAIKFKTYNLASQKETFIRLLVRLFILEFFWFLLYLDPKKSFMGILKGLLTFFLFSSILFLIINGIQCSVLVWIIGGKFNTIQTMCLFVYSLVWYLLFIPLKRIISSMGCA